jgi:signal transduction histidine kinase
VEPAEARLERLEELFGRLAGLSHKINNPLTSLLGRAQMLQMNRNLDPPAHKAVEVVSESARRVAEHMRELTDVVREGRELIDAGRKPESA